MIVNKPKGLVKPETKPVPNNLQDNRVKLQPKCRFCKHLDPRTEWIGLEVVMCAEFWKLDGVTNVEDISHKIGCGGFKWIDELKEVVE